MVLVRLAGLIRSKTGPFHGLLATFIFYVLSGRLRHVKLRSFSGPSADLQMIGERFPRSVSVFHALQ